MADLRPVGGGCRVEIVGAVPLIYVDDMVPSLAFWRDKLGYRMLRAWEPEWQCVWCWLARDRSAVMM